MITPDPTASAVRPVRSGVRTLHAPAASLESVAVGSPAAAAGKSAVALVAHGRVEEARAVLEQALDQAWAAGDVAGVALVAEVLGVVELADGRAVEAIEAFRASAVARTAGAGREDHEVGGPRSLRGVVKTGGLAVRRRRQTPMEATWKEGTERAWP